MKTKMMMAATMAALLTSCGTSHLSKITPDGWVDDLVWPDPATATVPEGSYPNAYNVTALHEGLSKSQVYGLIGHPHYREGVIGVREWDYTLHFLKPHNEVMTCRLKITFDSDYKAKTFYFDPEVCPGRIAQLAGGPAGDGIEAKPAEPKPVAEPMSFSADALFAFDSAELSEGGRWALKTLASDLKAAKPAKIRIEGFTDRLGSDAWNFSLSDRRAAAVRQALVEDGVPAASMESAGRGPANPKVQCSNSDRKALIACLTPNRRVEVTAFERP